MTNTSEQNNSNATKEETIKTAKGPPKPKEACPELCSGVERNELIAELPQLPKLIKKKKKECAEDNDWQIPPIVKKSEKPKPPPPTPIPFSQDEEQESIKRFNETLVQIEDNNITMTEILSKPKPLPTEEPEKCSGVLRVEANEKKAFEFFTEVLQLYKPDEIMVAFNGGKDCTVLLDLIATFFQSNKCLNHVRIPVLYIETDEAFDEIEEVVKECSEKYQIDMIRRKGCIKTALEDLCIEMPNLQAVFMGSRRTDPYCEKLGLMKACDPGWPPLMRVNPLIDWSYKDIWHYIFYRNVPYSKLYKEGYTSLGNKGNTYPNPFLRVIDPKSGSIVKYLHACELKDDKYERAGRGSKDVVLTCKPDTTDENLPFIATKK